MGRIAPRRKQSVWDIQQLWQSCRQYVGQRQHRRADTDNQAERVREEEIPVTPQERPPSLLSRVWCMPDSFRWMDPLPSFHRRGILIVLFLLFVVLLWPNSPATTQTAPRAVDVPLSARSVPMQAQLVDNAATPSPQSTPQTPPTAAAPSAPAARWQTYQIAQGQTLAQLFRDNDLPVGDVFAMAQVEGPGKPLSTLHIGQQVRLQRNAAGMVSALEIDMPDGQTALFIRQQDGTFIRNR
ncbi:LysM-like peptidoglycan-binding domain-containing protein [Musicola paradisiaca]|uniref:Opacity-associated protein A n=1 Tax=Musicola paradisiaca (strain Ech703) TaxID=579405 RepID=C6CAD5_MUSP7|nr:LysM-like peptidoglycan-binding domain-containing protein [Musicola paradisiaca]ACS84610.1 Opacity-associated protein A [Musicola paradisiaca Ech703]